VKLIQQIQLGSLNSTRLVNGIRRLMLNQRPKYWRRQRSDPFVSLSIGGIIGVLDVVHPSAFYMADVNMIVLVCPFSADHHATLYCYDTCRPQLFKYVLDYFSTVYHLRNATTKFLDVAILFIPSSIQSHASLHPSHFFSIYRMLVWLKHVPHKAT